MNDEPNLLALHHVTLGDTCAILDWEDWYIDTGNDWAYASLGDLNNHFYKRLVHAINNEDSNRITEIIQEVADYITHQDQVFRAPEKTIQVFAELVAELREVKAECDKLNERLLERWKSTKEKKRAGSDNEAPGA